MEEYLEYEYCLEIQFVIVENLEDNKYIEVSVVPS